MHNIYKAKSEKVIHVWDALTEFQKELYPEKLPKIVESDTDIMEAIGFSGKSAEFDKLLQSVDVAHHLYNPKDVPVSTFNPAKGAGQMQLVSKIPKKAFQFNCVKRAADTQESKAKRNKEVKLRYNRHKYVSKGEYPEPNDLVPFQEMLLVLRFYEPFKYKPARRLGHPRFNQEYYVLSSQYLTELKDKILCNCDEGPFYEMSETKLKPSESSEQIEPAPPKPGFFFIHDTFYNDLREESSPDYSSVIRKWAEKQQMIGELKSASMETVRFGDLKFRIGYPQLYQHQGNCEHLFVVSDCRLLASSDVLSRTRYPFLNSYSFPRDVPCNICGHAEAQFIVRGSNRHIFDPAYICDPCVQSYHYKDGEKIGEFELYKFVGTQFSTKDERIAEID